MAGGDSHERLKDTDEVVMGSERGFGIVFTVVFLIIAIIKFFVTESAVFWALFWVGAAAIVLTISLVYPILLRPFNILWFKFGLLLHSIVNPIVMGAVFFLTVTPIGLIMRLFGKVPLKMRPDPEAKSYWIDRDPPGPAPGSFGNQF